MEPSKDNFKTLYDIKSWGHGQENRNRELLSPTAFAPRG